MPWLGWIFLGALLLCSELLMVDAGFYLVFIGIAAIIVGLVELAGAGLVPWAQWLLFAVLAACSMVFFRKQLYAKLRGGGVGYETGPAGEIVNVDQALAPGQSGRQSYRGTEWTVVNESGETLEQGQPARIKAVVGLTLELEAIKDTE